MAFHLFYFDIALVIDGLLFFLFTYLIKSSHLWWQGGISIDWLGYLGKSIKDLYWSRSQALSLAWSINHSLISTVDTVLTSSIGNVWGEREAAGWDGKLWVRCETRGPKTKCWGWGVRPKDPRAKMKASWVWQALRCEWMEKATEVPVEEVVRMLTRR